MQNGCKVYMDSYMASCFMVTFIIFLKPLLGGRFKTTSHTRLRARDDYTLSTLIGGKGGVGSSMLHTACEGTNGVCECKMDVKSTWIPTWHQMDHVSWSLGLFSKTTSWR
jgi:hypothetical protein